MTQSAVREAHTATADVLGRLRDVCDERGIDELAVRLEDLRAWIAGDLLEVEGDLRRLDGGDTPAYHSARHLLVLEGKRLRPLCVLIAARIGGGGAAEARQLAVAAELVHSATLLHDDVVDVGDTRRGADAARVVYGNAASIFGGDWLLVEALSRVRSTGMSDLLDGVLDVLREMLHAESFQLANRGRVDLSVADYFTVVEGKTASLFRWAMFAGARAGGLDRERCTALGLYGQKLGVAFQVVDDVLDVSGDVDVVGKGLFADLREGKATYPLLLAMERDRALAALVVEACSAVITDRAGEELRLRIAKGLRATGAIEDATALARRFAGHAVEALAGLPSGRARAALESIALGVVHRNR